MNDRRAEKLLRGDQEQRDRPARHRSRSTPPGTLEDGTVKKRKRQKALPRVTVLAYSQRDLLAFTESVGALRHLVNDLRVLVEKMPKSRAKPTTATSPAPLPVASAPAGQTEEK